MCAPSEVPFEMLFSLRLELATNSYPVPETNTFLKVSMKKWLSLKESIPFCCFIFRMWDRNKRAVKKIHSLGHLIRF